ncbi:MAG: omp28 [Bacteroidetes bacterium]|nr:omp28 [Bacteroidota bacterium]
MKISLILISILVCFGCVSCDKVNNPIQSEQIIVSNRKVLLEDYTGHQCGNCPNAARTAEQLSAQYGANLVVIAVHAGFFTKLNAPDFVTSYTCQVGNDWDAASGGFGISSAGNPNGMVNRKDNGSGLIQKETKWGSSIAKALQAPDLCDMWLTLNYNTISNTLNTTVKTKFKKTYGSNTKLSVVLTEDSIIGPQKDYTQNPDVITNYVFMHMLREGINGSWGDPLKYAPIKYADSVTLSYNNFQVNAVKYKPNNLYVVAFVYDATTKEILEVEKAKVIK